MGKYGVSGRWWGRVDGGSVRGIQFRWEVPEKGQFEPKMQQFGAEKADDGCKLLGS